MLTQRITGVDIAQGRVRIPSEAKGLLPERRVGIDIDFLGHRTRARWDPCLGSDRQRSGVIGVARDLMALAMADDRLGLDVGDEGVVGLRR